MAKGLYRLDELGWLQFQELCAAAVAQDTGVGEESWIGAADSRRDTLLPGGVPGRLAGPTLASVLWLRHQIPSDRHRAACLGLLDGVRDAFQARARDGTRAASILLMTNAAHAFDGGVLIAMLSDLVDPAAVAVLGTNELSEGLDASPGLRRRMPATLGTTDLERLVPDEAGAASSFDRAAAEELAPVFVATRSYRRAVGSLERQGFVVLTGPPEVGKTAIAQMLGLVQLTDGWQAHDCRHPDELFSRYRASVPQIFLADDAFGSTEYRPDAAERWARELDRVLARMDETHWLIWTSRPAPLAAGLRRVHRERGLERFPDPGSVQVDASRLDVDEKVLILFRHARAAGLDPHRRRFVQDQGEGIVAHRFFTPERIRRLAKGLPRAPLGRAWLEDALRRPTEAMRNSLAALEDEHRDLLVALLDAPPSWVSERDLARALRRHHPGGLTHAPHELIDRLADHFLRVNDGGIGWVHPSWRDLVIGDLAQDAAGRARFLRVAGIDGVELALSVGGGARGQRNLPLAVDDADWDVLTTRSLELARELDSEGVARLLRALTEAVRHAQGDWRRREAAVLTQATLESTLPRLKQSELSLPLLEAWLEAAEVLPDEAPEPPRFTQAWARLLPAASFEDPEEVARAEQWLALAEVLDRYLPMDLSELDFPERYREVLGALVKAARDGADDNPLLEQAMARLARLWSEGIGYATIASGGEAEEEPLAVEPLTLGPIDVASVLRDLD